jgi:uncharacterized protein (TIGR02231 family)
MLLTAPGVVLAGQVEVKAVPREVTVYPDSAMVTRKGEAKFPSGASVAVIPDIPAFAEDASVRVSVEGPAGTKFFGIRIRRAFTPEAAEAKVKELQAKIRELQNRREDLKDRIDARIAEIDILKSLSKDSGARAAAGGSISSFADGTKGIGTRIAVLLSESRKDEREQRDLDAKIQALNQELAQAGTGVREKKAVEADLELPGDGTVRFTVEYTVPGASWAPVYDLHLTAGKKPKMDLSFAGQVRQSTGEDWKDVKLTLSTARPTEIGVVPDPTNWWLDFAPPPQRYQTLRSARMKSAMPAAAPAEMAYGGAMAEEAPVPVQMDQAATLRAEYATTYTVTTLMTIPTDGDAHRVGIAESSHDATISLVCVPRLAQSAFIEVNVVYGGEQQLLPGQANLFREGQFAGSIPLGPIAPGESFKVGLGKDDNMKVERKLITDKSAGGFLGFTKTSRKYRWVTTMKNFHEGARSIEVREQLPRSRQGSIVVEALETTPDPLAEPSDQPGLKRWKLEIPAGGTAKVVFSYQVKFPDGSKVWGLE